MESLSESQIEKDALSQTALMCPLTFEEIKDPVVTPQGTVFERAAIQDYLRTNFNCPVTCANLNESQLRPFNRTDLGQSSMSDLRTLRS